MTNVALWQCFIMYAYYMWKFSFVIQQKMLVDALNSDNDGIPTRTEFRQKLGKLAH